MTNTPRPNAELENLLEFIKTNRGFDFSGYKRTSLTRRLTKRMQTVGINTFSEYSEYLDTHPEEYVPLFNSILINVTGFFRDPKAWEYIDRDVLPRIIESKRTADPIRVWSAGCASGEETYSIAILLVEHLGVERFKEQAKIYSTDLDDEALAIARQGIYSESETEGAPQEYIDKYFERSSGRFTFNKELRRSIIFGRHDLIQDAPISRIDLLIFRNVLMYFNHETQTRILARLNYALSDNGFLFLGKAEMLLTYGNLFTPVSMKNRVFRKSANVNMRDRLLVMAQTGSEEVNSQIVDEARLREAAFETATVAQIVIDTAGILTLANEKARGLFHLDAHNLGRPFQDLELSYRPVELRSAIDQVYARNGQVVLREIEMPVNSSDTCFLDIMLIPLKNGNSATVGISISFQDVSDHKRLENQLEDSNQELETAMEELQSTNEELETTNEELQSTIEELETTNEELQSTNEELETMNEELQSTNEELETMNDEMSQRSEELNQVNSFLESILTGLRGGVVVLDPDLNVKVWNTRSEDLWGLRAGEVEGRNFLNLDIGLPVEQLRKPAREVLTGEAESLTIPLSATNRRGRQININVTISPLLTAQKEIRGIILVMEQVQNAGG